MNLAVKNGKVVFKEVYNELVLESDDGEVMSVCMRDSGFEVTYQGETWQLKDGMVSRLREEPTVTVDYNRNKLSPVTHLIEVIERKELKELLPDAISNAKRAVNNLAKRKVYESKD